MSKEYVSVRVTPDAKADAEEAKKEDETWDDYVRRCAENPPEITELVDAQEIINAIAAKADGEGRVDSDELARKVVSKMDYAELSNVVRNELERQLEQLQGR